MMDEREQWELELRQKKLNEAKRTWFGFFIILPISFFATFGLLYLYCGYAPWIETLIVMGVFSIRKFTERFYEIIAAWWE